MRSALLLLVAALLAPALWGETVTGRVVTGESPLPGCTVVLKSASWSVTTVTNAKGDYKLDVPRGNYDLTFELAGWGKAEHKVTIERAETRLGDDELPGNARILEEITLDKPCSEHPSTRLDYPLCADFDFDTVLIRAADHGDGSALELLRDRYTSAASAWEQQRIAAALIAHRRDDSTIWTELMTDAANAVRFAEDSEGNQNPDLAPWCAQRGCDPDAYYRLAGSALQSVSADPRSHALLLDALKTSDFWMEYTAISGLGMQKDETSLEPIAKLLERFGRDAYQLAPALAYFKSDAADRLAFRYIEEGDRAPYLEVRNGN